MLQETIKTAHNSSQIINGAIKKARDFSTVETYARAFTIMQLVISPFPVKALDAL
jgi:hypothetical protein